MKSLFIKEFRQGRPLLIFAAVMALLVPLLYVVFARAAFLYVSGYNPAWLPVIAGFVILGLPLFIAVFASAGLFCSEAHRGTLPILLALPLSRARIWLAKLLAAFALTLASSLLVLIIGGALLPGPYRDLPVPYHLLDLCCCIIFLLAVGAFCSSLSRSVNAAIPATVLLGGAIIAGAATLRFYYGAPLLGPPWLDIALWCLCTSPALLLASAVVVARGELLQSARKWLHAVPVALLGTGLMVLMVIGVTSAATRYHRSGVQQLTDVTDPAGGSALCLLAQAQPFRLVPRWLLNVLLLEEGLLPGELGPFGPNEIPVSHRANYVIALDLTTGRELSCTRAPLDYQQWTQPTSGSGACSRDGRLAALITRPAGFTWGVRQDRPLELRILDTEQNKVLYSGWPDKVLERAFDLSWSPSGNYLVLSSSSSSSGRDDKLTMHILNKDGSQSRPGPLILRSPGWAPNEDVIYSFDTNDNLRRAYPDDRRSEAIWSPQPKPEGVERWFPPGALSPDGKWFALLEGTQPEAPEPGQRPRGVQTLHLIPTDGGASEVIYRGDSLDLSAQHIAWSDTGRFLYFVARRRDETSRRSFHRLLCFDRETQEIVHIGPEMRYGPIITPLPRPHSDDVVLWCLEYEWPSERGQRARLIGAHLVLANPTGWRPLSSVEDVFDFAREHKPLGFDSQGRLILLAGGRASAFQEEPSYSRLEALDLDTGELQQLYP